MCQADFLHDQNPWWVCVYRYQRSCSFHTPNSCLSLRSHGRQKNMCLAAA